MARRAVPAILAASMGLSGCAGATSMTITAGSGLPASAAQAPPVQESAEPRTVTDPAGVQQTLDEVAAAFRETDRTALEGLLHDPSSVFGQRWLDRVGNMSELPLETYELELDESLPNMATDRVRARFDGADSQVVYVRELLAFSGFDDAPAAEDLFLTIVDVDGSWHVAGDVDGERFGFVSVDHLWDHGPVTTTSDGPIMAIHHPDGPEPGLLVSEAQSALAAAAQRWPLEWPNRVPVIVPRDEEELGELLHVTFDLSNFVAFATSTSYAAGNTYDVSGSRIVINPARFLNRSTEVRERILVHELVHVATRPATGPLVPSWLEEGIAQALGEQRSTTGTTLLDALGRGNRQLPTDGEFTVGGRDRIFLSYQLGWSFVDKLVDTYGSDAVGQFYAEVGRGAVGLAGTTDHHLQRASQQVFGVDFADLVNAWRT